jgi:hypothetical protein
METRLVGKDSIYREASMEAVLRLHVLRVMEIR